jgi:chromosomal replication initiation ATPase DnaA
MRTGIYAMVGILHRENNPEKTLKNIANHYGFESVQELNIRCRKRKFVIPRMICMCALYFKHKWTLDEAGGCFNRDHTTAIHAIQTIRDLTDTLPDFKKEVFNLCPDIIELIHGDNRARLFKIYHQKAKVV